MLVSISPLLLKQIVDDLPFYYLDLGTFSLEKEIITSAVITVLIYGFQLLSGMQNYKKHKLQLYKGLYEDIPRSLDNLKPSTIATNSVHYSGFLVGYMAWGFVICFHLILAILIGIRIISFQIRHTELVLAIVVPVLIIYLLKMTSMKSVGKLLFIQKLDNKKKKLNLKSRKTYALFVYFSFFAGKH
jgi:cytochrome c oxidase subunit IV